jgi:hypothetical protein
MERRFTFAESSDHHARREVRILLGIAAAGALWAFCLLCLVAALILSTVGLPPITYAALPHAGLATLSGGVALVVSQRRRPR